jgi:hypothetical protein
MTITLAQVEDAVGLPPIHWVGQCHVAASAIIDTGLLPGWKVARGVWCGPIEEGAPFDGEGRAFTQHSWCQDPKTGRIVDPTRFAFYRNRLPEIHHGDGKPDSDYDLCGCRARRRLTRGGPPFPPEHRGRDLAVAGARLNKYLERVLGHPAPFGRWELAYVTGGGTTYNPTPVVRDLCRQLRDTGNAALVPIDIMQWFDL